MTAAAAVLATLAPRPDPEMAALGAVIARARRRLGRRPEPFAQTCGICADLSVDTARRRLLAIEAGAEPTRAELAGIAAVLRTTPTLLLRQARRDAADRTAVAS